MDDSQPANWLDIAEVARRTGLSSRALRFYEAKGLVVPMRTHTGRRLFNTAALARLHQIIVLKSAGLSLAQMKMLFAGRPLDLEQVLRAQLAMLAEEEARICKAQSLIHIALSCIGRGEPLNAETLCSLVESGDRIMKQEPQEWQAVTDRYFTPEQKAQWAQSWANLPRDFDQNAYQQQWQDLGDRIRAALPMAPNSAVAQSFVDEWYALLKPFADIASPAMWTATVKMYDDMDQWAEHGAGKPNPGFDKAVWDFMKAATAARLAQGGSLAPASA